ncbi:Der1-like protein [Stemphylium lycopersici]|uniref:Derlin n=1 Tax=Stemphylium lycopersici TaxID=183478 RepID=A0A364NAE9_STELY|nr:Der1-like protein [Stemphylium lycopersici]
MVRQHGSLERDEETNEAAWEAARGALVGGTKWGAFFAVAGGVAYTLSPVYRGLTIQFKTYIQMSGMILGGMLEADKRMVNYQHRVRHHKRLARDMEIWRRYEDSYEERGTPGVGAESDVHGPNGKAVAVSALGYGGVISLRQYIFANYFVFTTKMFPQLWRVFTAFLITKPKFAILLDPYFLYQYGSSIERESSRFSQPGDFFVYTMFVGSVIVATAGGLLNAYTFLPALSLAYAYTFGQDNPTRSVQFFIINFDAKYLPFAMLFLTFIIDGPDAAASQLTGLIAAHLYDFLTRIWPTFGGGTNYIRTPQMVQRWFGAAPGSVQNRGYGHVVEGRGRTAGAPGSGASPSTGRATGASTAFGAMGPGRRLGE